MNNISFKTLFISTFFFTQTGVCGGGDRIFSNGFEAGVQASLMSLTRVNGVSPETIYFSAQESTCADCEDIYGLNTPEADAWGALAYHFNFDDSDSGTFALTGNSKNEQIEGTPRAAHTFHCYGSDDPNWVAANNRCEFNVGVRVQAPDNDFDDAFIQVNIQPLYGMGGYYSDGNIWCVSSSSDYSWCPHSDGSRQQTDILTLNNWTNQLVIVDNDGGMYSNICMSAEEENGMVVAYGPNLDPAISVGSRPLIPLTRLATRTNTNSCNTVHNAASIAALADDLPERNKNGELIDGFGFGQRVVGIRAGTIELAMTSNFIQLHDIDANWEVTGTYLGELDFAGSTGFCTPRNANGPIPCSELPYMSFFAVTDSDFASAPNNFVFLNSSCFGCGFVNSVVQGTRFNRADEHNQRINGAWGSLWSNNFYGGNHLGGTPKEGITVRPFDTGGGGNNTGGLHDLNKNPEDLTSSDFMKGGGAGNEFFNRYLSLVDNIFNETVQDADSRLSFRQSVGGYFVYISGSIFQPFTGASSFIQNSAQYGRYNVNRNISWNDDATGDLQEVTWYALGGPYHDCSDIHAEGTQRAGGQQCADFSQGTPSLVTPSAPGNQ